MVYVSHDYKSSLEVWRKCFTFFFLKDEQQKNKIVLAWSFQKYMQSSLNVQLDASWHDGGILCPQGNQKYSSTYVLQLIVVKMLSTF